MLNIALISPNREAYSETFIKAHKEKLSGNIIYYYGGYLPDSIESRGKLPKNYKYYIFRILNEVFKYRSDITPPEYRLMQSFRNKCIDIVFAEYGQSGAKCMNLCKRLNVPMIVHFHGFDVSNITVIKEYSQKYKEMFSYASYIIVVSKKMREMILELGADKSKVILNYYGPDEKFVSVNPNYYSNNFIAVGRFVDTKAPYNVLFAFKRVIEKYPDSRLIMVGDGPLLGDCMNIARNLGLETMVTFHKPVNQTQLKDFLEDSFCFVQHSVTTINGDMEGTPNTILEASISGLPVISTYHAGIPDVIIHDKTGYLVDEHDVNQMAEYMCKLYCDRKLAKLMGEKGKENILLNFNQLKSINTLDILIKSSISIGKLRIKKEIKTSE